MPPSENTASRSKTTVQNSISGSLPCVSDTDVVAILRHSNFNFKILVKLIINGEENDMLNTLK